MKKQKTNSKGLLDMLCTKSLKILFSKRIYMLKDLKVSFWRLNLCFIDKRKMQMKSNFESILMQNEI